MTITQILQAIHQIQEEGDTDYPSSSEEDFVYRIALVNDAIRTWKEYENTIWETLVATHSDTTVASDTTYSAPADFVKPTGLLKIYNADGNPILFDKVFAKDAHILEKTDPSKRYFYITGSPGEYVINLNPTPTTANGLSGKTLKLDYMKEPTYYSTGEETQEPEMTDHMFIVHWVLAQMNLENYERYDNHTANWQAKIRDMASQNEQEEPWADNEHYGYRFGGFGR